MIELADDEIIIKSYNLYIKVKTKNKKKVGSFNKGHAVRIFFKLVW